MLWRISESIKNGIYLKQKVVQDKNIITSNCVGSLFEFGFKLVSVLKNERESKELESKMIIWYKNVVKIYICLYN